MKWQWIIVVALMTTLIPGCGGSADVELVDDDFEDGEDAPLVDDPAADIESPNTSEVSDFEAPFPTKRSFFSPPEIEQAVAVPSQSVDQDVRHATVRVIGFSQIGDSDPQALISVQGILQSVRAGETVGGVTVVAMDAPNVTLQQRNERWTVALFSQSLVNEQVAGSALRQSSPQHRSGLPAAAQFEATVLSVPGTDFAEARRFDGAVGSDLGNVPLGISGSSLPPAPMSLPPETLSPMAELPDDLDLPEPPALPRVEASVDQPLPGIDEIPQTPSF